MEKTDSNQQKLYFVIGRNFVVRKWATSINHSLDLHNYLGGISGLHGFPSKFSLLMWRGEKNTDTSVSVQ